MAIPVFRYAFFISREIASCEIKTEKRILQAVPNKTKGHENAGYGINNYRNRQCHCVSNHLFVVSKTEKEKT